MPLKLVAGYCKYNILYRDVLVHRYKYIVIPKFLPRGARSSNKKNRNLKIVKNNSRRTPGSVDAFDAVHSIRTDTTALVCWAIVSDSGILYTKSKSYLPIFPTYIPRYSRTS